MAEMTRPLLADRDEDLGRYRPISILAIVAIVVTGLFTLLVVLLTAAGILTRKPVLEPALILIDAAGIALALVARWQIKNSEGTQAGGNLAKWALGIGILFGCVYVAYFFGNVLAIKQQAKEFAQAWLTVLQKKNVQQAFFLTVAPTQRKGREPSEMATLHAEMLTAFQNLELIRACERAKDGEIVVEPQGVYEWRQSSDGLVVTVNCLLRTREGEFDLVVAVVGTETPDVSGREWHVRATNQFVRGKRPTLYGRFMTELQSDSLNFMQDWLVNKVNTNRPADMYLDMEPLTTVERNQKSKAMFAQTAVAPPIAAATIPGGGIQVAANLAACFVPNAYTPLVLSKAEAISKKIEFTDPPPSQTQISQDIKDRIRPRILRGGVVQMAMAGPTTTDSVQNRVEVFPDAIRSTLPLDVVLPVLNYRSRGQLIVVCHDRELVAKVNELANGPWDKSQPVAFTMGDSVLAGSKHYWTVEKIVVGLERSRDDPRPGGGLPMDSMPR